MVNRARLQSYYSEELWGAISVYEKFARNSIKHDTAPDEQYGIAAIIYMYALCYSRLGKYPQQLL